LALALVSLVIGYRLATAPRNSPASSGLPTANQPTEISAAPAEQPNEDSEPREVLPTRANSVPQLPAVIKAATRSHPSGQPVVVRTEPAPYTRQLVAGLTNLDFSRGSITKEQAEQWTQNLQALTGQGAAAVPAIREFLAQNQELNFSAINGGELLGQNSLRSAFINALQQIGGPEATALMVETLQTTTLPSEIALLAQNLELQAPGQYRQQTINAVSEVLGMAEKGQLAGWDVGALFQVLQSYGDATTANLLEQLQSKWKYYATMSLAGLPEGTGVPSLVRALQDPQAGAGKHDLAFQMLAQVAWQYPDASIALIEAIHANQIPDNAWRRILTGLVGDQYYLGTAPSASGGNGGMLSGLKTFHIEAGNQNFYSLPVSAMASPEEIAKRRAVIEQLLAANPNPGAIQALQTARSSLAAP